MTRAWKKNEIPILELRMGDIFTLPLYPIYERYNNTASGILGYSTEYDKFMFLSFRIPVKKSSYLKILECYDVTGNRKIGLIIYSTGMRVEVISS